jgi:hypothetical protein
MVDEVSFEFDPLEGLEIPEENRAEALDIAANFIKEQVLSYVHDGDSPVEGEGPFKDLNKKYADEEKMGDETPNLELTGAMLNALEVEAVDELIRIHISGSEAGKAEGHNQHQGPSNLPQRRFIPAKGQSLRQEIHDGIKDNLEPLIAKPDTDEGDELERNIRLTGETAARLFDFDMARGVRIKNEGSQNFDDDIFE